MTIHKEGYKSILLALIFALILSGLTYFFVNLKGVSYFNYGFALLIFIIILQFFRIPKRYFPIDEGKVMCPADGKVVVIEETFETEYFNEKRIQISVFMSPINVHVNLYPISGVIKYAKYHAGLFLVAWHPKSSTDNERTTIVIENKNKVEILVRQVAGVLARRIVYYCEKGDSVTQGNELGFIKFGSRVDLFLPLNSKILVSLNQKVKGKQTVLAELNN